MFPEAYADPGMQKIYEDEKAWGLPLPHFDFFIIHSIQGCEHIRSLLGLKSDDDPFFCWDDEEMFNACSKALLALRDKENLTNVQVDQLCWLEKGLMWRVICIDKMEQLGKYAPLLTGEQVKFMQVWNMHFREFEDDLINNVDTTNVIEFSPEEIKKIADLLEEARSGIFSLEDEQKGNEKRERVLKYLKTIK